MDALIGYVGAHSQRGDCLCGKCLDAPKDPKQPTEHTADVHFFKVARKGEPTAEKLRELVIGTREQGEFVASLDLFDGQEHSYIELGGWIGDQGQALGYLMGLWKLNTPKSLLGDLISAETADNLAGRGMITIQAGGDHK